jgi:hypothetical protein
MQGKHEEADVMDHEAVTEPSDPLGLDSTSKAVMPGSKNALRRSATGLIMVHGHPAGAVTPAAESRQGLQ